MEKEKIKASELLKFNFSATHFRNLASIIADRAIKDSVKTKLKKLDQISQKNNQQAFDINPINKKEIVIKFYRWIYQGGNPKNYFTSKDLRYLIYNIDVNFDERKSIYEDTELLNKLITIIDLKWQNSYLLYLFNLIIRKWRDTQFPKSFDLIFIYFNQKLKNYDGTRKTILNIKNNKQYFDNKNGDLILGADNALKGKELSDLTKTLNLPEYYISYRYFTRVILMYIEKSKNDINLLADEFTNLFNNYNVKQKTLIISSLIIKTEGKFNEKIQNLAFNKIGDPEKEIIWDLNLYDDKDKSIINDARYILNEWIKNKFITIFFENVINDSRRKNFWLSLQKHISSFRVVCTNYIVSKLQQDSRIKSIINERLVKSYSGSSNAAIIMKIKNKIIVEFSDNGACYVYNETNPHAPKFNVKEIISTDSLKNRYFTVLFLRERYKVYYFQEQGKVYHMDGIIKWEAAFREWMKVKLDIYVSMD